MSILNGIKETRNSGITICFMESKETRLLFYLFRDVLVELVPRQLPLSRPCYLLQDLLHLLR